MKFRVRPARRMVGRVTVPGDKSISHRALLFAAIAEGMSEIHGCLEAEDCRRTLAAVEALGADVNPKGPGHYRIVGPGPRRFHEPNDVIDCGNSGTTARLLMGILAGQPFTSVLTGDDSLRGRPMARVAEPLRLMGATIVGRAGATQLPLAVQGVNPLRAIDYDMAVASAQVKSAILLAGLYADQPVSVTEPVASRDHTERLLRKFGAVIETRGRTILVAPGGLRGTTVAVPGDISSAAFLLGAALVVGDGHVTVEDVGVNPTRTGALEVLAAMGAGMERGDRRDGDEPTATLTARAGELRGTAIGGDLVPRLIDEIPILAVAAAFASGTTEIRDAAELRVKESDRIAALARELGRMGADITERADGLTIRGGRALTGARVASGGDHRLAMALTVAALGAHGETIVEDTGCVATSFPEFAQILNALTGDATVAVEA